MKKKSLLSPVVLSFLGMMLITAGMAAAEYPERAIEILVPFGAGGGSDTAARAVGEGMKEQLKNGIVINNMPGGGATKGMLYVSQQPADGMTILAVTTSHLIDAVKPKTRVSILQDFEPLCRIQWDTSAVIVSGEVQVQYTCGFDRFWKKESQGIEICRNISGRLVGNPDGCVFQKSRRCRDIHPV